ncbi:hypothetical protein VP1G_09630 [Cytospora mali]|uniref:Uncharacterized protein n=1 Tax=Cytospora mali TaxID=578113 RepID=A0A194VER8_CYTMA|nr:hypothetical protein VP1G_09630 [Valsa mali var. pyri (nom. inval.)]
MKPKIFGPASPTGARPRTGHQSIRGRISGPIPMSNSVEDDEFPIRNPGTGIASSTPIEDDPILQRQLQQPAPIPAVSPPPTQPFSSVAQSIRSAAERAEIIDVPQTVPEHPGSPSPRPNTPGPSGPSPEGGGSSGVSAMRSSPARYHRTNPSSSNRFSTLSVDSSKEIADDVNFSGHSPPQRKKSTLRSALGKFLRRRKKEGSLSSVSEIDRQSALEGTAQHRSVPPASRNAPPPRNEPAKRVASMPIHEFDRALRSHSIGPDDITAIESVRNSMSLDAMGSSPARRRATTATNSRLFTAISGRSRGEEWAGLSPRPASTHGRGSRFTEEDPEEIGRAITSDSSGDMGHKRRSRSLSQLDELAQDKRDSRRRSDEIRYWRESYDIPGPLSPLSSLPPNENETEANDYNFDQGRTSMSIAESAAVDKTPQTPPQPFNFGSIASMNEMAGMKITQAATLDERFGSLEARVYKLERVVDQLCHSVPGFKWPFKEGGPGSVVSVPVGPPGGLQRSGSVMTSGSGLQRVPVNQPTYAYSRAAVPMIPSIYQTDSMISHDDEVPTSSRRSVDSADDNNSAHMSFGEGRTYIDSLHPPSSSATQALSPVAASTPAVPRPGHLRPTSESTVRPAASMPSLGSQSSGDEQSSNLAAQLEAERAARQALEAQVRKLSERMNNLSTTMFAMVRDPAKAKSYERLRPQTAASSTTLANSAYLAPISGNTAAAHKNTTHNNNSSSAVNPSSKAQSIFGREGSLASKASSPTKEVGDDEYSEAFQTPRETPGLMTGSQFEPFGEVDEFGAPGLPTRI